MHPAVLLGPVGVIFVGLIVAVLLSTVIAGSGYVIDIIWLAWGLLMLGLILRIASWLTTYYVVTSLRMLRQKGLLVRKTLDDATKEGYRRDLPALGDRPSFRLW